MTPHHRAPPGDRLARPRHSAEQGGEEGLLGAMEPWRPGGNQLGEDVDKQDDTDVDEDGPVTHTHRVWPV